MHVAPLFLADRIGPQASESHLSLGPWGRADVFWGFHAPGTSRVSVVLGAWRHGPSGHSSGVRVLYSQGMFVLLKVLVYINFKLQCLHCKMTPLAF